MRTLLASLLLLLALTSPAPAMAQTGVGFSLRPAGASQAYFIHDLAAGATRADELLVLNSGDAPLALDLYAVDAVTGATTGAVYTNRGAAPTGAGAWLRLPEARLEVPANSTARVPFEIRVPSDVGPGQYLGGIAAQASDGARAATNGPSAASRQGQFTLTTVTRSVVAVAVTVPGPLERRLTATEVRMLGGPGGARLGVGVRNDGNVMVKPRGQLVLRDGSGERGRLALEMDTILPGGSAQFAVPWPKELPAGQYRADVLLETSDALPSTGPAADQPASAPAVRAETTDQALTVEPSALEVSQSGVVNPPGTTRVAPADAGWPWWIPVLAGIATALNGAFALALLRRRA